MSGPTLHEEASYETRAIDDPRILQYVVINANHTLKVVHGGTIGLLHKEGLNHVRCGGYESSLHIGLQLDTS